MWKETGLRVTSIRWPPRLWLWVEFEPVLWSRFSVLTQIWAILFKSRTRYVTFTVSNSPNYPSVPLWQVFLKNCHFRRYFLENNNHNFSNHNLIVITIEFKVIYASCGKIFLFWPQTRPLGWWMISNPKASPQKASLYSVATSMTSI